MTLGCEVPDSKARQRAAPPDDWLTVSKVSRRRLQQSASSARPSLTHTHYPHPNPHPYLPPRPCWLWRWGLAHTSHIWSAFDKQWHTSVQEVERGKRKSVCNHPWLCVGRHQDWQKWGVQERESSSKHFASWFNLSVFSMCALWHECRQYRYPFPTSPTHTTQTEFTKQVSKQKKQNLKWLHSLKQTRLEFKKRNRIRIF